MQSLINQQVNSAIAQYLDRPEFYPERRALNKTDSNDGVFDQVSKLLQTQASLFEGK